MDKHPPLPTISDVLVKEISITLTKQIDKEIFKKKYTPYDGPRNLYSDLRLN